MTRDEMIEVMWNAMVNNPNRDIRVCIRAALSAIEADGLCIVPIEATPVIVGAWYRHKNGFHFHDDPAPTDTSDYGAYRAMIEAGKL